MHFKIWEGFFFNISSDNIKTLTLGNIYRPPRDNNSNTNIEFFYWNSDPLFSYLVMKSQTVLFLVILRLIFLTIEHNYNNGSISKLH